jgi:hypothetical protein
MKLDMPLVRFHLHDSRGKILPSSYPSSLTGIHFAYENHVDSVALWDEVFAELDCSCQNILLGLTLCCSSFPERASNCSKRLV